MENISNLKISKIGWTSIYTKTSYGKVECILVKKNLFKGYTIIDANGNKVKKNNLDELCDLTIVSHSKKLFASQDDVKNMNQAFQVKHDEHVQDVQTARQREEVYKRELTETAESYEKTIKDINEENEREKDREISQKINYLVRPLKNVIEAKWTEEGTEVVYDKPNELQKQHFGVTVVPRREPYKRSGTTTWGMEEYLEILYKEIDQEYTVQVKGLQSLFRNLNSSISMLRRDYSETKYVQTIALETRFAIEFSNLITLCWVKYSEHDISYYSRGTHNLQNGETEYETREASSLVHNGKEACANLLESIMGEKEKANFLARLELLSATKTEEEVVDEAPKTM